MKGAGKMAKRRSLLGVTLLCLGVVLGCARGPSEPDVARLDRFLGAYFNASAGDDGDPPTRMTYLSAATDLNADNVDETLVYLTSRDFCGSGGCTLLILTPREDSYRVVTRTTMVRLPIRVLDATSNGWRNLSVTVQGGGIVEPYEAELAFDGDSYPTNPSMPPARRLQGATGGEVLIAER